MKLISAGTLVLISLLISFSSFTTTDNFDTTIVVVDGKALLVDIDESGKILTTYMEVPEYFNDPKDHDSKVVDAKATYKRLSKAQMDQIRFISMAEKGWELDEFMVNNLADLAIHYQQTYANQIVITAAQQKSNKDLIASNVSVIKEILLSYGVSDKDIVVDYKTDLGDEPTRFVKVVSNLKQLSYNSTASR